MKIYHTDRTVLYSNLNYRYLYLEGYVVVLVQLTKYYYVVLPSTQSEIIVMATIDLHVLNSNDTYCMCIVTLYTR